MATGTPWDSPRSIQTVDYAPRSDSTEILPAILVVALLSFLTDLNQPRPAPVRPMLAVSAEELSPTTAATVQGLPYDSLISRATVAYAPRSETIEVLPDIAPVVSSPTVQGLPYDSLISRATVAYAPRSETIEVLPDITPVVSSPTGWGPWLYSEPAFCRYTIITADQDEVLPSLAPPPPPAPWGPWLTVDPPRVSLYRPGRRAIQSQTWDALAPPPPLPYPPYRRVVSTFVPVVTPTSRII